MLSTKKIFEKFEALSAYTFTTIDGEYPETRIAHFLTYDDEGLYFQTMKVKPFYCQLKKTNKVAACSLVADSVAATHDEDGLPDFPEGFFIKISGDVRELSFEELTKKSENDSKFLALVNDIERYPTMTTFILYRYKGELYDYDFAKKNRDHKLERERFSFGGMNQIEPGFKIQSDKCIACDSCFKACTFDAIIPGEKYSINSSRCDECGSCYSICPVNAVIAKTPMDEEYRKECGKKIRKYMSSSK
ncbi:4Fe-4S binding protein [Clostridium grantii]|uniref:4Fe-4S dicluster domain-containing protein n=1 Tax=Clostridium grantii DSM 8605 TaxID=1121316 RepID=A0A1M5XEG0_9CLOT|nr:4Fe-4S binding protein [Clostridium grantii]SHH98265.1 4Fe-4S dicluster domain-containing protein [Clostridium grantii DSM 8605]